MKILLAPVVGAASLLTSSISLAQNGSMMNGGTGSGTWMNGYGAMGGYGGIWVPILLVIAVAGVVAWIVAQKRK